MINQEEIELDIEFTEYRWYKKGEQPSCVGYSCVDGCSLYNNYAGEDCAEIFGYKEIKEIYESDK